MSTQQIDFSQFGPNSGYIRDLYHLYLTDPSLVGGNWGLFFQQLSESATVTPPVVADIRPTNGSTPKALPQPAPVSDKLETTAYQAPAGSAEALQERIYRMVSAFRNRGHLGAKINPLLTGVDQLPKVADTDLDFYNFTEEQLARQLPCAGFMGKQEMQLGQLLTSLDQTYCGSIGFEIMHLLSQEERLWLQRRVETRLEEGSYKLTKDQKIYHLKQIINAVAFEEELHKKYIGHKRFSLQGGETIIPMIETILDEGYDLGVREAVLGMAHRGRLNVLHNVCGKRLSEVFSEFEDQNLFTMAGSGDVKYHMGYESTYTTVDNEQIKLSLAPNPSHLEFVYPIVEGMVRARQDLHYNRARQAVLGIVLHGDAAFVGQGVVPETLNLSNVPGYQNGGTIHLIINNQIGFTTTPGEARSCVYCTDFAKAIQAPILHVNCENVEACCWAAKLAVDFRNRYGRDVILDLYCYRKYGHNEGDDPSFTQPVIYEEVAKKKTIAVMYAHQLVDEGIVTKDGVNDYWDNFKERFAAEHAVHQSAEPIGEACSMHGRIKVPNPETGVAEDELNRIAATLVTHDDNFTPHPKLHKILQKRVDTLVNREKIDWGFAEALAFGSLLLDGKSVRLSGQDCERGTFSQRHLVLIDNDNGSKLTPFNQLDTPNSAVFDVYNSPLSEVGVMGFEYGYSVIAQNKSLIIWEGQFGDFVNGAQVILDQFLSSSEQKWDQLSGLTLMLPHGYEGQGPEHSSARLERFLQMCADGNMVVCVPSTAAQHFHLLRRQGLMDIKRPLIVMTPKSLLRSPDASAEVDELTGGHFQTVIAEDFSKDGPIEHVVLVSGKVYYDVVRALGTVDNPKTRVVRVEQLYPFPQSEIDQVLKDVQAKTYTWVQEEPYNMGSWLYIEPYLREKCHMDITYVGRTPSASTATGSPKRHAWETEQFCRDLIKRISS